MLLNEGLRFAKKYGLDPKNYELRHSDQEIVADIIDGARRFGI